MIAADIFFYYLGADQDNRNMSEGFFLNNIISVGDILLNLTSPVFSKDFKIFLDDLA
jgi:hypothetical protein